MKRYAAKLLFQFKVIQNGVCNRRRVCEVRTLICRAPNALAALSKFDKKGRKDRLEYRNARGGRVKVEYVGIVDLIHLHVPDEQEVWYDITELIQPMERKKRLIPRPADLCAVRNERESKTARSTRH